MDSESDVPAVVVSVGAVASAEALAKVAASVEDAVEEAAVDSVESVPELPHAVKEQNRASVSKIDNNFFIMKFLSFVNENNALYFHNYNALYQKRSSMARKILDKSPFLHCTYRAIMLK